MVEKDFGPLCLKLLNTSPKKTSFFRCVIFKFPWQRNMLHKQLTFARTCTEDGYHSVANEILGKNSRM